MNIPLHVSHPSLSSSDPSFSSSDPSFSSLHQLIARIDHPEHSARRLLHDLLVRLGTRHAQVLPR